MKQYSKDELTPELIQFLEQRLADYRKNLEKVMSIQEMEERLLLEVNEE